MSTSKLSLLTTCIHILLLLLLIKFDEVLFTHDLENAVMLFIFLGVIVAFMLAISAIKTKLGFVLMIVNGIYLLVCLFMLYFIANFTFKV